MVPDDLCIAIWYILYNHASTISLSVAQGYEADIADDLRKQALLPRMSILGARAWPRWSTYSPAQREPSP